MLAQQNVETLNEAGARKIVASCPHCFNTLANEYPQLGGNYEVIHHTQLLARLVADGKLTPVTPDRREDHLPRPVLPRQAQPGLHRAAGDHGAGAGRAGAGDAPVQGARVLLRRGRGPDVDGGADRQADQHRADRRGARHRPGHDLHRLPVLPGHARRRGQREEEFRRGEESLEVVDVAQLLVRSVQVAGRRRRGADAAEAERPRRRWRRPGVPAGLTAAEAFSDGVFAVAITVLVFNLLGIGSGRVRV